MHLLLLIQTALSADCATRPGSGVVAEEARAVATALEAADPDRFTDGMKRLEGVVACLGEVPPEDVMATVHLYRGVQRFGAGDVDAAAGEFLAARSLSPDVTIPVYPAEHEINGVLRRHDPIRAERGRLPPPKRGTVYVDGYETRDRFVDAPALVQLVDGTDITTYDLGVGQAPSYPSRHPVRNGLGASAIGLGAAGAGLLAASAGPRAQFQSGEATSVTELNQLRSRTNTLAGSGLAAISGGVVTGALAVVWRDR